MIPSANSLGAWGEEQACFYLAKNGYSLLARNWRAGHLEVDIIAEEAGEIVFVEVKTRSYEYMYTALDAVDYAKKYRLTNAALTFMQSKHLDAPYRFDIITLVGTEDCFDLTHYVDAFQPRRKMKFTRAELW